MSRFSLRIHGWNSYLGLTRVCRQKIEPHNISKNRMSNMDMNDEFLRWNVLNIKNCTGSNVVLFYDFLDNSCIVYVGWKYSDPCWSHGGRGYDLPTCERSSKMNASILLSPGSGPARKKRLVVTVPCVIGFFVISHHRNPYDTMKQTV